MLLVEPVSINRHKSLFVPVSSVQVTTIRGSPVFCSPQYKGNSILYILKLVINLYSNRHPSLLQKHQLVHFLHLLYSIHHNNLGNHHNLSLHHLSNIHDGGYNYMVAWVLHVYSKIASNTLFLYLLLYELEKIIYH